MEKGLCNTLLIFQGETNDPGFLDRPASRIPRGRHNEIGQCAPLNLRRTLEQSVDVGGQTRFQPGYRRFRHGRHSK